MFTTKKDIGNIVADDNGCYFAAPSTTRQFKMNVLTS